MPMFSAPPLLINRTVAEGGRTLLPKPKMLFEPLIMTVERLRSGAGICPSFRSGPGAPSMAFRFVHTADIHLDSPLRSLALRNPELAELVGDASRQAFTAIADLCLEERVDALVVAGDLYDGDQTSMKTARFLASQMTRLHQAGVRVYMIRGNHDAMSRITKQLVLPDTVTIFGGRCQSVIQPGAGGGRRLPWAELCQPESARKPAAQICRPRGGSCEHRHHAHEPGRFPWP